MDSGALLGRSALIYGSDAFDVAPLDMRRHEERWASRLRQDAVYLLAWRGNRVVGRLTLLFRSRYPKVRSVLAGVAERADECFYLTKPLSG